MLKLDIIYHDKIYLCARGCHSLLYSEATAFERSQRPPSVSCGQIPRHLRHHSEAIHSQGLTQLVVAKCHNY